ncbi:hypothetical protein GCM10022251_37090 [Phytohabitans flavus]|uniref:NACHT domain-containing protein n=1 Tax=Phytohabitans flavus TaxID=1076124 RepID=A0A6F8XW16_9ACTN|nr:hypothetical protein Pflav_043970 [Phytohabitans flavus]
MGGLATLLAVLARGPENGLSTADSLASVASAVVSAASLAVALVAIRAELRRSHDQSAGDEQLAAAAAWLAHRVGRQWREEIETRRLQHPQPLRLRWAKTGLPAGSRAAGLRDGALVGGSRQPAAGLIAAFRRLRTRQLVIRGAAGSGKSTLAVLCTVAALEPPRVSRADGATDAAPEPVPVLLPLSAWQPAEEELRAWAARWIAENYPELADARRFGPAAARELVEHDRVLLVLDGLDELPVPMRREAARRLGDAASAGGLNMIITCRQDEYDAIVAVEGRLPLAAEITISPIGVEDAVEFLTGGEPPGSTRWDVVVAAMRAEPDGHLAEALSTPLMISLARTVYRPADRDPAELVSDFDSAEAVEAHLLAQLVPAVYRDHRDPAAAERYLATLARLVRRRLLRPDLAWWQLGAGVPPDAYRLTGAVLLGLLGAAACGIGTPFGPGRLGNVSTGALVGVVLGVVAGRGAERAAAADPAAARGRGRVLGAASLRDAAVAAGLTICLGFAGLLGQGGSLDQLPAAATIAAVAGLLSVVNAGIGAWRGAAPARPSWRLRSLVPRLVSGLGTGLLFSVPAGLVVGLLVGIERLSDTSLFDHHPDTLDTVLTAGRSPAIWTAVLLAGAIGLPLGVGRWLATPLDDGALVSPRSALRSDWTTSLAIAVTAGLATAAGIAAFVVASARAGWLERDAIVPFGPVEAGFYGGLAVCAVVLLGSGSAWVSYATAQLWLGAARRLPRHTIAFLEDAHGRGLLRQVGMFYQFRHDKVEQYLAPDQEPSTVPPEVLERRAQSITRLATAASAVALPLIIVLAILPAVRRQVDDYVADKRNAEAGALVRRADELAARSPQAALQLRIAAAETDSDASSRRELGETLRIQASGGRGQAYRLNWTAQAGDWFLGVDMGGNLLGWWSRAAGPEPERLDTGVSILTRIEDDMMRIQYNDRNDVLWDFAQSPPRQIPLPFGDIRDTSGVAGGLIAVIRYDDDTATIHDLDAPDKPLLDLGPGVEYVWFGDGDGRWAAVETLDGSVRAVPLAPGGRAVELSDGAEDALGLDIAGNTLHYGIGLGREYRLWDLSADPPREALGGRLADRLYLSADGEWAYTVDEEGPDLLWRLGAGAKEPVGLGPDVSYGSFETLADGRELLVTTHDDGAVQLWDLPDTTPQVLGEHIETEQIDDVTQRIVLVRDDGTAEFRDLANPSAPPVPAGTQVDPERVFAQDGYAQIGHTDGTTALWRLDPAPVRLASVPQALKIYEFLASPPWAVGVLPDRTAMLWNLDIVPPRLIRLGTYCSGCDVDVGRVWAELVDPDGESTAWRLNADGSAARLPLGPYATGALVADDGTWAVFEHERTDEGYLDGYLVSVWSLGGPPIPAPADPVRAACAQVGPMSEREWWSTMPDLDYHRICAG